VKNPRSYEKKESVGKIFDSPGEEKYNKGKNKMNTKRRNLNAL